VFTLIFPRSNGRWTLVVFAQDDRLLEHVRPLARVARRGLGGEQVGGGVLAARRRLDA